jgi:rubredoxin
MASTAALREKCTQCGWTLIAPEWSENVGDGGCVHIWRCPICSYEFETTDNAVEKTTPDAELAEEFLPNLLVA